MKSEELPVLSCKQGSREANPLVAGYWRCNVSMHSVVVEDRMEMYKTETRETSYLTTAMVQVHMPGTKAGAVRPERRKWN